jgi:hypothetical protein
MKERVSSLNQLGDGDTAGTGSYVSKASLSFS